MGISAYLATYEKANLCYSRKQFDKAIELLRTCIAIKPDFAEGHLSLGYILLRQFNYLEGFKKLVEGQRLVRGEAGFEQVQEFRRSHEWTGQCLEGKTILLFSGGGFGDTIQLIRYAPVLVGLGGRVVVICERPLERLLSRIQGVSDVVRMDSGLPPFDYMSELVALPHHLKTTPLTIPPTPYIQEDNPSFSYWPTKLSGLRGLKVGVCWSGNPGRSFDHERSIGLSQLLPLLTLAGKEIHFVSLQKGGAEGDIAELADEVNMFDPAPDIEDFLDLASIINTLDLIISVDSAPAHLAGAMGKPVWMLSRFHGCWRWGEDTTASPWYPSMQIFRQSYFGDWESLIENVTVELKKLARNTFYSTSDQYHKILSVKDGEIEDTSSYIELSISEAFSLAIKQFEVGNHKEAAVICEEITLVNPNHSPALNLLGLFLLGNKQYNEARNLFEKAIIIDPNAPEYYNNLGSLFQEQNRLDLAESYFRRAVQLNHAQPEILGNLGYILQLQQKLDEAVNYYRQALLFSERNIRILVNLGICLAEKGELHEAALCYQKALAINPYHAIALNNLGNILG